MQDDKLRIPKIVECPYCGRTFRRASLTQRKQLKCPYCRRYFYIWDAKSFFVWDRKKTFEIKKEKITLLEKMRKKYELRL